MMRQQKAYTDDDRKAMRKALNKKCLDSMLEDSDIHDGKIIPIAKLYERADRIFEYDYQIEIRGVEVHNNIVTVIVEIETPLGVRAGIGSEHLAVDLTGPKGMKSFTKESAITAPANAYARAIKNGFAKWGRHFRAPVDLIDEPEEKLPDFETNEKGTLN